MKFLSLKKLLLVILLLSISLMGNDKPNILIFIADDAGMDFGCYGYEGANTPNVDRLASSGLMCTKAFLTVPQCSPSRTSILSGQFAHTIGTEDLHTPLDENTKLIPSYLKDIGYYTGFMLKGHIGKNGIEQFDWNDHELSDSQDSYWHKNIGQNFSKFLDNAGDQPFFMWCAFYDPHRAYSDHHDPNEIAPVVNDPNKVFVPPYLIDDAATRQDLSEYYDEITRMDSHIGEIVNVVNDRGLRENTLIIFMSDNGMPFPRAKGTLYDSGIQTPLIFNWSGKIEENVEYDQLLSVIDLAPTILDLVNLKIPLDMYGESIQKIFYDQTIQGREYIFAERNWHDADEYMRSVRTEEYLLIYNAYNHLPHGTAIDLSTSPSWYSLKKAQENGSITVGQNFLFRNPRFKLELYNVKEDPYQINNLTGNKDYLGKSQELAQILFEWMKETDDHPPNRRKQADIVDRVSGFPMSYEEIRDFMGGQYNE